MCEKRINNRKKYVIIADKVRMHCASFSQKMLKIVKNLGTDLKLVGGVNEKYLKKRKM